MSQKNFASYGDMETLVTEIADKCGPYTEISYEDWLQLTPYQQEHGRWDVTDVPGADGTISIDLMTKLWENPSPTSAFAAQTVALSDMDYDLYFTVFRVTSDEWYATYIIDAKISGKNWVESLNSAMTSLYNRGLKVVSNGISFDDARVGTTTNNSYMIPYRIYGIKLHHTVEIKAIAPTVSTLAEKCMLSDGVTSVEDKLSGYVTIQNTSPSSNITWKHGDYTYFNNYKPSNTDYTWYLLNVMPSVASVIVCGIQTAGARALVYLPGGGSVQSGCNITWLGVKN